MNITIQIKHRVTDAVLYEHETTAERQASGLAMRDALEKATQDRTDLSGAYLSRANLSGAYLSGAYLSGANLSRANLSGADLSGADLSRANLSGSDLSRANLSRANLSGSDLSCADLSRANLYGSDLSRANLSRANLSGAYLSCADLSGADLSRANLSGSDLSRANLSGSDLSEIRADYWDVLIRAPHEIAGLRAALVGGLVNGSTYEGYCACLVGTIANVRSVEYRELGNGLTPNSSRQIEQWFMGINTGDTPETNQQSALAVQWLDEFVALLNAARAQKEPT